MKKFLKVTLYSSLILASFSFVLNAEEINGAKENAGETTAEQKNVKQEPQKKTKKYKNKFIIAAFGQYATTDNEFDEPKGYKLMDNIDLSGNGFLYGASVRYKMYFNKYSNSSFFMTPEVFYSFGKTTADSEEDGFGAFKLDLTPSYGFKLSLGYEFSEKLAISVGGGAQNIKYDYSFITDSSRFNSASFEKDKFIPFMSVDLEYNFTKYFFMGINLHYYFSSFDMPNSFDFYSLVPPFEKVEIDRMDGKMITVGATLGFRF